MSNTGQILRSILPEQVRSTIRNQIDNLEFRVFQWRSKGHPTLKEPIFLIGCPRSGTTIGVRLFATHPWVANWSELGHIWDPTNYYDPDAEHYWNADMVTEQAARRLHARFEYYRHKSGKPRFINKHPRNSVRIDYMREIFPDAFFIHLIRDGRAVVNSIITQTPRKPTRQGIPFANFCKPPNWRQFLRDDPVEQAALQWREIVGYVLGKRSELGDRYHEFKYEDMCSTPREVFASAFEFAGLPVSDAFLSGIPERLENRNFKYEEKFSQAQLDTINTIQKDLLQELGYKV